MNTLIEEINTLRNERKAIILAHNYVAAEIQDIADFTGDSLELSIKASTVKAPVIVFCGVSFMAETAKVLSPDSRVLLPVLHAGCPMADMAPADQVAEYRRNHPNAILVAYINTTAATKAHVDICCTSANAEKILASLPEDREIMFLPDRNLGANVSAALGRPVEKWPGCCPVHDAITVQDIQKARADHPGSWLMVHPECRPEVVALADAALSTGAMLRFARSSALKEFTICTEMRILHRLKKENPDKIFHWIAPEITCDNMQKITLEDVRNCLRDMTPEIILTPETIENARKPIERMLAVK